MGAVTMTGSQNTMRLNSQSDVRWRLTLRTTVLILPLCDARDSDLRGGDEIHGSLLECWHAI